MTANKNIILNTKAQLISRINEKYYCIISHVEIIPSSNELKIKYEVHGDGSLGRLKIPGSGTTLSYRNLSDTIKISPTECDYTRHSTHHLEGWIFYPFEKLLADKIYQFQYGLQYSEIEIFRLSRDDHLMVKLQNILLLPSVLISIIVEYEKNLWDPGSSLATKWIAKQLNDLVNNPLPGFSAEPMQGWDMFICQAMMKGPRNTPYDGGIFILKIEFARDSPFKPPKIEFLTKVYHCEIREDGKFSLDILHDHWSPAITLRKILIEIQEFFIKPNPDFPIRPQLAKLYKENKAKYDNYARSWTQLWAR